jgi:general secretion pathway protein M
MKAWLDSLAERERRMVIAAAAIVILSLLYMLIVSPLLNTNETLRASVAEKASDYEWMQSRAAEARSRVLAGPASQKKDSRTLIARVTSEMRTKNITPVQVRPQGETRLNLTLRDVNFINLMDRLEHLQSSFDIRVANATIEPGSDAGLVNAQLTLAR